MEERFITRRAASSHSEIALHLKEAREAHLSYGLDYLDRALLGILPTDLVLLGARTGSGKTAMLTYVAGFNATRKRNVLYIALEAEDREIEMRLKYKLLAQHFYNDPMRERDRYVSYQDYRYGILDDVFEPYQMQVEDTFNEQYGTLFTVYRKRGFCIDDLRGILEKAVYKEKTSGLPCLDLICIDHFHYFEMAGDGDLKGQQRLMQELRDLTTFYRKPILMNAHLRKDVYSVSPSEDNFHGSSEIAKQATVVIMVAKDKERSDIKNGVFSTAISIPKRRVGGAVPVVGIVKYYSFGDRYAHDFELATVEGEPPRERINLLEKNLWPAWANENRKESYFRRMKAYEQTY